jgi:leader peptidase (prepilin peptidase)/N-methyltransferase
MPFHFWTIQFLLVGAMVGSFLNVCIHRMPRGPKRFSVRPRTARSCGYRNPVGIQHPGRHLVLAPREVSGLSANPISVRYVMVEIVTTAFFCAPRAGCDFGREQPGVALAMAVS